MKRYQGNTRGISPGIFPGNATLRSGKTANREIGDPRVGWEIKKLDTEGSEVLNSILGLI